MTENISRISEGFLSESREFIENPDALSASAAAELYDMSEILVKSLSLNRQTADMALRVELCRGLDAVLERIIDAAPSRGGTREKRVRGVYTPAAHRFRRWHNSELMKDKGLTGYMLALELGGSPVMFFGDGKEEYPYLPNLPGIALPRTDGEEGGAEIYSRHLTENYEDMDVLVLHGMYSETAAYLDAYRALRPDGKVYCGLDMSRYWMCKTDWGGRDAVRFASQCNLTATSCRSLRDALNADPNVSFPCRFMPNGFYNPNGGGYQRTPAKRETLFSPSEE